MLCPGRSRERTIRFEAEVAQLRVAEMFAAWFLACYPDGVVLSDYGYMDRTTAAPLAPGTLHLKGRPDLNRVFRAMSQDFRRHDKDRDYRKSDVMGFNGHGSYAEVIEVTTWGNQPSAAKQMTHKLDTLRRTVNQVHNLHTDWQASRWQPRGRELYYPLPPRSSTEFRWICYVPTIREQAPQGVILYEIHKVSRRLRQVNNLRSVYLHRRTNEEAAAERERGDVIRSTVRPPALSREVQTHLNHAFQTNRPTLENVDRWAQHVLATQPTAKHEISMLEIAVGATAVVVTVAVVMLLSEVALAAMAASAVVETETVLAVSAPMEELGFRAAASIVRYASTAGRVLH